MESVFGWLQQIFDGLLSFVPTRVIVPPTSVLLKYKWDGSVSEHAPGLRWYFPLLTRVEEIAIKRQSINDLPPIQFLSAENYTCLADAACVYNITSAQMYATENFDTENMLREAVSASLCACLMGMPLEEFKNLDHLNSNLTNKVEIDTEEFGVEIEFVRVNNLTQVIPLSHNDTDKRR